MCVLFLQKTQISRYAPGDLTDVSGNRIYLASWVTQQPNSFAFRVEICLQNMQYKSGCSLKLLYNTRMAGSQDQKLALSFLCKQVMTHRSQPCHKVVVWSALLRSQIDF